MVLVEVIDKLQGIIGTLIGSIGTLIITQYLRSVGKTELYVNSWNVKYYKKDGRGGLAEITEPLESDYDAKYFLDINIYNSSDIPMSLRDIYLKFVGCSYEIKSELFDSSTKQYHGIRITMNPVGVINVPPKEFVWLKFEGVINKQDIKQILGSATIYFSALDYKGREFCKEIAKLHSG